LADCFLRYQFPLGLAERWAVADSANHSRTSNPCHRPGRQRSISFAAACGSWKSAVGGASGASGASLRQFARIRQGDEFVTFPWTATARRRTLSPRLPNEAQPKTFGLCSLPAASFGARPGSRATLRDFRNWTSCQHAALSLASLRSYCGDRVAYWLMAAGFQQNPVRIRGAHHAYERLSSLAQVRAERFSNPIMGGAVPHC